MEELLIGYPVVIEIPIAWGEMDAFQHVNNVVYFRYFESARIAYFQRLDLLNLMEQTGVGPILASVQCRFKFPLTYPDTVSVGARATTIEEDRFTIENIVVSHRWQRVAATGSGVLVSYAYQQGQKTSLPPEVEARIMALEGVARREERV
jgi:acyl-CoA thioester hydrolase